MDYDLIVIGAGPAGGVAAAEGAAAGMRVALIEKHPIPRHKTCGGGMPMIVGEYLRDLAPGAFVEADVRAMRHTWRFGDPHLGPINPPDAGRDLSLWMVQRSLFDAAIARRAERAGAELRDGLSVRAVEVDGGAVTVRAATQGSDSAFTARASYVLGADGANGVTARAAGLRRDRALAIGMEIEHPHRWGEGHPELRKDVLHLEYGAVPRGYAWIFPKAEHLNVGAGVFRPRGRDGRGDPAVRSELEHAICGYLASLGVPFDRSQMHFHAHPVPIWDGRQALNTPDGRILLAGDAAGLVNPLFGDGILNAIKSGRIAAACLVEGKAAGYTARLHAELAANLNAAQKLSRVFYQWTGIVYRHGIQRPGASRIAARLLAGDAPFTDVAGKAIRRIRDAMIGRGAPEPAGD